MKTEIRLITPSIASAMLESNHLKQRNAMPSHVRHLASQMQNGQWMENGEPIIISNEGDVLDGQHRLLAIIESETSQKILVVTGVAPHAFITIDTGRQRTGANIFSINQTPNYKVAATTVAGVLSYQRALSTSITKAGQFVSHGSLNSSHRPSTTDMVEHYAKYKTHYETAISIAMGLRTWISTAAVGTVSGMALIYGKKPTDEIVEFWKRVKDGAGLHEKCPSYKFRERMIANRAAKARLSPNQVTLLAAKAWNLWATEKQCGVLRVESEAALPIE